MMRQTAAAPPPADEAGSTATESVTRDEPAKTIFPQSGGANEKRQPPPRGLFGLMQRADADEGKVDVSAGEPGGNAAAPPQSVDDEDDFDDGDAIAGTRTAVNVRHFAGPLPVGDDVDEHVDQDEDDTGLDEADEMDGADDSRLSSVAMELIDPNDLEPERYRLAARQARRQGWLALVCGLAAVAASALSLWPTFLATLPATSLGFIAIITGYMALTGAGRRDLGRATRGILILGMLLGTAGIFLGPLLFAGIGRSLRETTGEQLTRRHLQHIGEGLDHHYAQHGGYPIGGTFGRDETGVIRGQHGWMTFLLPFVGEAELYRQIDQSKPFDDAVNRDLMGRNVTVYFAAGGDRSRIGQGFAVSHFAGLGGEIDDANGLSHIGIFERDVAVKREEITDGLSNTLIVGELAGLYPPWGEPENWRRIGRGLNRDVNGFGSYEGHGAMFLLADGSVKFFNNKTDPKLLEKMSTRDGGP
jgi:hypothetical protein